MEKNNVHAFDVLGSKWTLWFEDESSSPRYQKHNGWCDNSTKQCHVCYRTKNEMMPENPYEFYNSIARHEIIHAFLYESGIVNAAIIRTNKWCKDEMMIDWMAAQMPKIYEVFKQLNIM